MAYLDTPHKRKSAIATTLVMVLLLFLIFTFGLKYFDPPLEYGIAVNFGTSNVGSGNIQPTEPLKSSSSQEEVIEEADLADKAASVLRPRPPTSLDDELEQIVDAEIVAYHRLHPTLLAEHAGEFVAVAEQKLVDHDVDKLALYRRIQARYPEQFVLVRRVEHVPEPELHVRSPRYNVPTT